MLEKFWHLIYPRIGYCLIQASVVVCLVVQCIRLFMSHVSDCWTVACQAPLSMGILQARVLEWVAMPSSRGSSQAMD